MISPNQTSLLNGMHSTLPLMIGGFPFGMVYSVLAIEVGISSTAAQSMLWMLFVGAAQFITTHLIRDAVPVLIFMRCQVYWQPCLQEMADRLFFLSEVKCVA